MAGIGRAFAVGLAAFLGAGAADSPAAPDGYLYRATLVQAAPGRLLELIELYKTAMEAFRESGDEPPLWMRHSQGDRWDLLLLFPMGTYQDFYRSDRVTRRQRGPRSLSALAPKLRDLTAWEEDVFVYGPPLEELRAAFSKAAFFHVEMFHALAGKQAELLREREMENAYSRALERPLSFVFVRDQGADWDLFTVGAYRDLKHYAGGADIPESRQERAAREAGFESASRIGPYLRGLISSHHDTLAVAVK